MRKTGILLVAVALFATLSVGQAQAQEEGKKLGVSLDVTYMSKWMSRGVECYSEDGAFFETVDVDLWGTGFGFATTHQSATGGGWVNMQRMNYKVYYGNSLFDDKAYKTKYNIAWVYENWYDKWANAAGKSKDIEMCVFNYSLPNLLGSTGLIPYGITTYDYPAESDDGFNNSHWDGWVHRFGIGYDLDLPALPSPLHLSSDIAYTDGLRAAEHDWSFATFGISTKFKLSENMAFVPGIYQQVSMDDSVCDHDVTYCKVSMKYKF